MENLIVKTYDSSVQGYAQNWIEEIQKNERMKDYYKNPTLSLYTSMVYGFANKLPYSMDIEQPEYVPADFLNMVPNDALENDWFKWEDRRTFFNAMTRWGDTFKSGMLLQMCNIFQKMILGQFPTDFALTEEDYTSWGIDLMTNDQEYNRCFFETLKSLPDWYQKLLSSANNEERRSVLDMLYSDIMNKISARYDSFKEVDTNGSTITEYKGIFPIDPSSDVSLLVNWENVRFHNGIPTVIEAIKGEQIEMYDKNKTGLLEESHNAKLK